MDPFKGPLPGVTDDERLLLTLTRNSERESWGFSGIGAKDILEQVSQLFILDTCKSEACKHVRSENLKLRKPRNLSISLKWSPENSNTN